MPSNAEQNTIVALTTETTAVEQQPSGLPQLDFSTYEEQFIWLILSFSLLYVLVSRFIMPRLAGIVESREERINDNLNIAEKRNADAASIKQAFEATRQEATRQAQDIMANMKADIQAKLSARTTVLDGELQAAANRAETEIATAKSKAINEIEAVASDLAVQVIGVVSGPSSAAGDTVTAVGQAMQTIIKERDENVRN